MSDKKSNLEMADEILIDYIRASSLVDMGNLYFAALQYKDETKRLRDFVEWLEQGFSGMFGRPGVDPKDEAWEMIPQQLIALKDTSHG